MYIILRVLHGCSSAEMRSRVHAGKSTPIGHWLYGKLSKVDGLATTMFPRS